MTETQAASDALVPPSTMPAPGAFPRVEMRGIVKRFHGVLALDSVDIAVRVAEVHALVGENGAGKSTLIKILTGVHAPDSGDILLDGARVAFRAPHEAQVAGIATIYQEVNLVPTLSAAENLFLGREPRRRWAGIDWARVRRDAQDLLQRYDVPVDVGRPVDELGLAAQQMVAIVRALSLGGRILVMDEPTSALTHREVDHLMGMVARIRDEGVSVLYISHRLDELYRIADRVTVLRDGHHIVTAALSDLPRRELVSAMLGRELERVLRSPRGHTLDSTKGPTAVSGPGLTDGLALSATEVSRQPRVTAANVAVRAGQVMGLAGLQGSGRTELLRLIFGADERDAGRVSLSDGAPDAGRSPSDSLRRGVAYLPEDRKTDGIIPDLSLRENLTLIVLPTLTRWGVVRRGRERAIVDRLIAQLGIRAANADIRIRDLSGGNQQKVLLARLLCSHPRFLLLDDPMRGIDVGAKAEIERLILELAGKGLGVMVASSELEEVLSLSDRITVMRDGRTVGVLEQDQATFETVATAIAQEAAGDRLAVQT
ncbi:MAG: sugar ABC transporter ATP-binding protein [Chloroflexi bacterium]|nr:sugar ABC transporter ATP-binding protein [Chloroflexota bacterium]